MRLQRLRLSALAVTAPADASRPAVLLDEIGFCPPTSEEALVGMRGEAPRGEAPRGEPPRTRGGMISAVLSVARSSCGASYCSRSDR